MVIWEHLIYLDFFPPHKESCNLKFDEGNLLNGLSELQDQIDQEICQCRHYQSIACLRFNTRTVHEVGYYEKLVTERQDTSLVEYLSLVRRLVLIWPIANEVDQIGNGKEQEYYDLNPRVVSEEHAEKDQNESSRGEYEVAEQLHSCFPL